jgi:hypothetical protein
MSDFRWLLVQDAVAAYEARMRKNGGDGIPVSCDVNAMGAAIETVLDKQPHIVVITQHSGEMVVDFQICRCSTKRAAMAIAGLFRPVPTFRTSVLPD